MKINSNGSIYVPLNNGMVAIPKGGGFWDVCKGDELVFAWVSAQFIRETK